MTSEDVQVAWHWRNQMIGCFDDLRDDFARHDPPITDREVIPSFSGEPDDMVIWLICQHTEGVGRLETVRSTLTALLQERMADRGFPSSAVESLIVSMTSLQDIESGGGRFYFFR